MLAASVVVKWFHRQGGRHVDAALVLREQFSAGELRALAPPLLALEVVNLAARRWRWPQARLERLAEALALLRFDLVEPDLATVARWAARGLTAFDAAYVAVAEQAGAQLITDDDTLVRAAPGLAVALADAAGHEA
ncbi:MAG: type II toxin-antitoxin system VapC family toxin [Solirubrobacteraceae bacterium]